MDLGGFAKFVLNFNIYIYISFTFLFTFICSLLLFCLNIAVWKLFLHWQTGFSPKSRTWFLVGRGVWVQFYPIGSKEVRRKWFDQLYLVTTRYYYGNNINKRRCKQKQKHFSLFTFLLLMYYFRGKNWCYGDFVVFLLLFVMFHWLWCSCSCSILLICYNYN